MTKRLPKTLSLIAFLSFAVLLTGCPVKVEEKTTSSSPTPTPTPTPAASHDHADEARPALPDPSKIDFNIDYDDNFHEHDFGRFGGLLAILGSHQFHVEIIPWVETGDVIALLYDNHFRPVAANAKEISLAMMVEDSPKTYTFLIDSEAEAGKKPAIYKISDPDLSKRLTDGWKGDAQVSITVDDAPASGRLIPLK